MRVEYSSSIRPNKSYLIDSIRKKSREPISSEAAPEAIAVDQNQNSDIDPLDRVWATAIFSGALTQMRQESPHWDLFLDRV